MEKAMLDKLIEQEILIKELKEENFVLVSQLNVEQQYDYKERIDKAIEYIKNINNYQEIGGDMLGNNYIKIDSEFIFKLEDILKGEDE